MGTEGVEGPNEGGVFHQDGIPFVAEDFRRQFHDLGGTAGDDEGVVVRTDAEAFPDAGFQQVDEGAVPFRHAVLEGEDRLLFQNFRHNSADIFHRESLRSRVACRKGNDFRVRGGLQDLTDRAGLEVSDFIGKLVFHSELPFQLLLT